MIPIQKRIKLAHHLINDSLLFSVSPRAGHFTFLTLAELLQKNKVKCEMINFGEDVKKIASLKKVKKVKFVRNPFNRTVSSYTTFCNNPVFKLWGYFGLNLEQKNDLTFRQFIQLLKTKNIQNIDHHLTNQVENGEGELFSYDRIEKIENYLDFLPDLLKEAGVNIDLSSLEPKHIRKRIDSKEPAMDIPFKDVFNSSYYNLPVNAQKLWNNEMNKNELKPLKKDFLKIIENAKKAETQYIDTHQNIFTSKSFENIISVLIENKILNFSSYEFYPTQKGFHDFMCVLYKK